MKKDENEYLCSCDVDIEKATPMIKQYLEIKRQYMDSVLLYRMGDFYETFFEDAVLLSKELELTLTHRGEAAGANKKIPLAGIPAKALEPYLIKLIDKKYKIAICEQEEPTPQNKGLLKREVVKIITAGTITDNEYLKSGTNNYLTCLFKAKNKDLYGLAYTDISTGEFKFTQANFEQILSELARIKPAEILAPAIAEKVKPFHIVPELKIDLPEEIINNYQCSKIDYTSFDNKKAIEYIKRVFDIASVKAFSDDSDNIGLVSVGVILEYIFVTQKGNLPKFNKLEMYDISEFISMDINTRKNLELLETVKDKNKVGSLFWTINKTKTNMGERLLKKWITQPLKDIVEINKRLNSTEEFINNSTSRLKIVSLLDKVYDIERLSTKISNNSVTPRDFISLKNSLALLPNIYDCLKDFSSSYIQKEIFCNEKIQDFVDIIEKTIIDTPPITIKEGGIIKNNVSEELDYYKDLLEGGQEWLKNFENTEKEKTGIKFLRVGFSKTFGYFIEISNSNLSMVPSNYIRRQTLTNGERFITEELKKHETEVLSASSKLTEIEYKIFIELREYAKEFVDDIRKIAEVLSEIDVFASFANISVEARYVKPEITNDNSLIIKNGRHPVVEKLLPLGKYVANDLELEANTNDLSKTQFMVLTGPNMAGKSTYMRQNALIVILAQIGCYVPADYAKIGIVDKIFTRVGAVDDLSLGQSTFMVEMSETAFILNSATEKSLILLDEIGRGTSTYDGVAIAWAVAEYLATTVKARAIFATHYHELNVMANLFAPIKNYRITITENEQGIEFLRKVVEGSASKSYGIHVAKMAGLPQSVVANAEKMMVKMQKNYSMDLSKNKKQVDLICNSPQLTLDLS